MASILDSIGAHIDGKPITYREAFQLGVYESSSMPATCVHCGNGQTFVFNPYWVPNLFDKASKQITRNERLNG